MTNTWIVNRAYDSLQGKFVRNIIPNDVVTIAGVSAVVGSTLAFTTISSSFEAYLVNFNAYSSSITTAHIMGGGGAATGTSTLFSIGVAANANTNVITSGGPTYPPVSLLKITGPSTISIGATVLSTLTASATFIRYPIFSLIEGT